MLYFSLFIPLIIAEFMRKNLLQSAAVTMAGSCTGEIKELSLWTRAAGRSLVQLVKIPFYGEVSALHHLLLRL